MTLETELNEYFRFAAAFQEIVSPSVSYEDLHDFITDIKQRKFMHIDAFDNGCTMRRNLMRSILEDAGVECGDIIIECDDDSDWDYHYAVTVTADGKTWVVDPTTADKPLSINEWIKEAENFGGISQSVIQQASFIDNGTPDNNIQKLIDFAEKQAPIAA